MSAGEGRRGGKGDAPMCGGSTCPGMGCTARHPAESGLLHELDQAADDWAAQPEWIKPITPAADYASRCEGLAPFACGNPDCPAHTRVTPPEAGQS